jgi:hypothetical protein
MSNIVLQPNSSGTGSITIASPNTNTNRTLNIPDVAGNIVTTGDTGTVTSGMVDSMAASKLTGALPAISGAALTNLVGSLSYNGGTTLSNLRIQTGTVTTPNSSIDAGTAEGVSARYYNNTAVTLTGFASTPTVFAMALTNYHETVCSPIPTTPTPSASGVTLRTRSARTAGIQSISLYYIAIGQAS